MAIAAAGGAAAGIVALWGKIRGDSKKEENPQQSAEQIEQPEPAASAT